MVKFPDKIAEESSTDCILHSNRGVHFLCNYYVTLLRVKLGTWHLDYAGAASGVDLPDCQRRATIVEECYRVSLVLFAEINSSKRIGSIHQTAFGNDVLKKFTTSREQSFHADEHRYRIFRERVF